MREHSFSPTGKVFTVGHSTRTLEELVSLLDHYGVEQLVDIRHFPMSRRNPQFNRDPLAQELPKHGISYAWIEQLGGFRTGGYEEHMKTDEFAQGVKELESLAKSKTTAYMCAELLWFRCHRRFLSDVLVSKGWTVVHIYDAKRSEEHKPRTQ